LWSYNAKVGKFLVSPEPDIWVILAEAECNRCHIFGKHGLWNVLSPNATVAAVQEVEWHSNEKQVYGGAQHGTFTSMNQSIYY
jgi:hypothetical protein